MKVMIPLARLSFPDLFDAVQYQGQGDANYRAQFLVEPGSEGDKAIRAAIQQVATEKWKAKAPQILASIENNSQKNAYVSGDTKAYDGYAGMMALSASRKEDAGRPSTLKRDGTPAVAADGVFYSGCYVMASVEFWAQDNNYGKAIRCTLRGVKFVKDGQSFGATTTAADADEFPEMAEELVDDFV